MKNYKVKFQILILLLLLFLFNTSIYSQLNSEKIDLLMKTAMEKFNVVGAAVAIVKDGKVIHSRGYGLKTFGKKGKVNQHTQFAIASNSKAFTTAALALLVEDGKMSWNDKVIKHIPEFKMYNDYVTQNFNIQDLLTHRSGLGLGVGDLMLFPDGSDFTIDDIVRSFQHFETKSAFRTKFDYDNLLYFVAGELIKRVSGMSWEKFVKMRIMDPLKMVNSFTSNREIKKRDNLASPHSTVKGRQNVLPQFDIPIGLNGAAGAIYSSVDDIAKWMLVHLNKGKYGKKLDKTLFSASSQREMWKIHTTLGVTPSRRYQTHFAGYGLGWNLRDIRGNLSVYHTGGLPGMLSRTDLCPDMNLGVIILTNTSDGGGALFNTVSRTIIDSYLGLKDFGWMEKIYKRMQSRRENADKVTEKVWETVKNANDDHIDTKNYIGIYEDNWFGKIEIFTKKNKLWFKAYRSPKLNGEMFFYKANSFAIKWEYQDMNADAFAIFSLDEEGKAERIRMKGISPNIDFSFDFQDLDLKRLSDKK